MRSTREPADGIAPLGKPVQPYTPPPLGPPATPTGHPKVWVVDGKFETRDYSLPK